MGWGGLTSVTTPLCPAPFCLGPLKSARFPRTECAIIPFEDLSTRENLDHLGPSYRHIEEPISFSQTAHFFLFLPYIREPPKFHGSCTCACPFYAQSLVFSRYLVNTYWRKIRTMDPSNS